MSYYGGFPKYIPVGENAGKPRKAWKVDLNLFYIY
jgi:hypothetical protein